jgi:hypothetical protein
MKESKPQIPKIIHQGNQCHHKTGIQRAIGLFGKIKMGCLSQKWTQDKNQG